MTTRATLRTLDSNSQPISPSKQALVVPKPHSQLLSQAETVFGQSLSSRAADF